MRIDPRLGQQAMMQLAMKRQAEGRGGFPQTQANNQVPPAIASRVTMLQNMAAMGNQTALGVLEKIKGMIMSGTASEMERLKLQSEIDRLQKQIDALRSAMQTMQNNNG